MEGGGSRGSVAHEVYGQKLVMTFLPWPSTKGNLKEQKSELTN